jgi:hypothetical protein
LSREDAESVFTETKKWLWLCAHAKHESENNGTVDQPLGLFQEAYAIDQAWHVFLLFTQDYAEFCEKYFGFFVHHVPEKSGVKKQFREALAGGSSEFRERRLIELERIYGYIYDQLGEETLLRWTEDFPQRFRSTKLWKD